MKFSQSVLLVAVVGVLIVAGIFVGGKMGTGSVVAPGEDITTGDQGQAIGPWANKVVEYELLTTSKYAGTDVASTAKVYAAKPADWGNPRGDFSKASLYTSYTASSGVVSIDEEQPGSYFVVLTATGYNTEFVEITIPDGTGRTLESLSDYNAAPDRKATPMSLVGATTDKDFAFTLVNETNAQLSDTVLPQLTANTELRGWKVIVNDQEGFSTDADGDGVYDEAIKMFKVNVCGVEQTIFEPARSVDLFDSNNEYTFLIESCKVADKEKLEISVEIKADTLDRVAANDEKWGEGEGVLSYIKVYDAEGSLFTTTDVTA